MNLPQLNHHRVRHALGFLVCKACDLACGPPPSPGRYAYMASYLRLTNGQQHGSAWAATLGWQLLILLTLRWAVYLALGLGLLAVAYAGLALGSCISRMSWIGATFATISILITVAANWWLHVITAPLGFF